MANPDYYDLKKLRQLYDKPKGKPKANPNTAIFSKSKNSEKKTKINSTINYAEDEQQNMRLDYVLT